MRSEMADMTADIICHKNYVSRHLSPGGAKKRLSGVNVARASDVWPNEEIYINI